MTVKYQAVVFVSAVAVADVDAVVGAGTVAGAVVDDGVAIAVAVAVAVAGAVAPLPGFMNRGPSATSRTSRMTVRADPSTFYTHNASLSNRTNMLLQQKKTQHKDVSNLY